MKTNRLPTITALIAIAACAVPPATHATEFLAGARNIDYFAETKPAAPKNSLERLQDLQARHETAFADVSAVINRLPTEPEMLGTKELFSSIDKSVRELKNVRTACDSLMTALRGEVKAIQESPSFSDDQKKELKDSANVIAKGCDELSKQLDHTVKRLGDAYKVFPEWNRVYRSYSNLKGETNAREQLKSLVGNYMKSFTPEPEKPEETTTPQEDAFAVDDGDSE